MAEAPATVLPAEVPTKVVCLTRWIKQARGPDKERREEAFNELYKYVVGPMLNLITGCVKRSPGHPVSVSNVLQDAVATLFVDMPKLVVNDTGHFRALMVTAVHFKLSARRRANRHLAKALTDDVMDWRGTQEELDPQERFEAAVEALASHEREEAEKVNKAIDESPTPLADVVRARLLAGLDAGGDGTAPPARNPSFEEIGKLLGIDAGTANRRYWEALVWLHNHFPDVVPKLPEKKKRGPKKGNGENGGAS